jgi:membrane associated rhomboid family serine protease
VVRRLRSRSLPWFGIALLLFVLGSVLGSDLGTILRIVAIFAALGACMRAVALAVRDDPVSSASIYDPTARMLGWMRAESATARRRRERDR